MESSGGRVDGCPSAQRALHLRRRSVSLGELLADSLVHDIAETGERIVISRGWPAAGETMSRSSGTRAASERKGGRSAAASGVTVLRARQPRRLINEEQKRRLLVEFLTRDQTHTGALHRRQRQPEQQAPRRHSVRQLLVQYDLPAHTGEPIALAGPPPPARA